MKRKCKECDKEFIAVRRQLFCGKDCRKEFFCRKNRKNKDPYTTCRSCGVKFKRERNKVFCSPECAEAGVTYTKTCVGCGVEFETTYSSKKYCTDKCRDIKYAKNSKRPMKLCIICKEEKIAATRTYCKRCSNIVKTARAYVASKHGKIAGNDHLVKDRIEYMFERKDLPVTKGRPAKTAELNQEIPEKFLVRGKKHYEGYMDGSL